MGLAVYEDTPEAIHKAHHVCHKRVLELFAKEKWNAGKCFHSRFKKWVRQEVVLPEEFCAVKTVLILEFKWNLARLAVSELIRNGNCQGCGGTGRRNGKECQGCAGFRKRPLSDTYKYSRLFITKDAWDVWSKHYNLIFREFGSWLSDWETHIAKHVDG